MTINKILLGGLLTAGLVACGDNPPEQAGTTSSGQASVSAANLLERVPADTPYLFLNTEGMSDELYNQQMQQYSGMLDAMAEMFNEIEIEEDNPEAESAIASMGKFYALLADIDDSKALREKTGLSPNGQSMFYGAGIFPVLNMQIVDPAKASATFNGLISDQDGNNNIQSMDIDGVSINKLTFAENHLALYWQVNEQHAVFSVLPIEMESNYLSGIFGDARPDNAASMDQITSINQRYGFSNYGSGYLDLIRVFEQLTNAESPEGASLAAMLQEHDNNFLAEPACVTEVRGLLNKAPRMYFGVTELSADIVAMRSIISLDSDFRTGLASVVGNAPINNDPKTPLNFGLNLNLAGMRDFIAEQSSNVSQSPFTCSHLEDLNAAAEQMNAAVNQPMLPLLGNINGLRFSMANLNLDNLDQAAPEEIAQNINGHVVLYSEQPNMLIGLGQMTLPFLAGMDLEPGGEPQLIESEFIPAEIGPAYLAVSDSAIGLSIGDQQQTGLTALLNADSDSEAVLFNFGMDYKLYSQFISYAESLAPSTEEDGEDEQFRKLMQQMYSGYENLGYSYTSVKVNEQGVVMDQIMYMND